MKCYIARNKHTNQCAGRFFFFAIDYGQFLKIASEFQGNHNMSFVISDSKESYVNRNYIIEFDLEPGKVKEVEIKSGYVVELR
jgi:hypothetical protein